MTPRLLIVPSEFEAERLLPRPDAAVVTGAGAAERDARRTALPAGVELLVCGVGLLRAGLAVAARVQRGDVRDALLIGLCGTRDPSVAPLSALVVGTAARNEAFGAGRAEQFLGLGEMGLKREPLDPEVLPLCEVPISAHAGDLEAGAARRAAGARDTAAAHRAAGGRVTTGECAAVHGVFGSVAAASGSLDEARGWHRRHPDVLAEEMETYAVALACARAGVPLACVRAVSNAAGDRDMARWDIAGSIGALRAVLPALLALPPLMLPSPAPVAPHDPQAPRDPATPRDSATPRAPATSRDQNASRVPPASRASREPGP